MPAPRVTQNSPWHVVLVLDDSSSMEDAGKAEALNEALDNMVEENLLKSQGTKNYIKLSVVVFGTSARVLIENQKENSVDKGKITQFSGQSGSTNMAAGLDEATALLLRNPGRETDFDPYVFLLTDGKADDGSSALASASRLKDLRIAAGSPRLVTCGLGETESDVDMELLRKIASSQELARHLKNPLDLGKLFPAIGTIVASAAGTEGVDSAIINL